MNENLEKFKKTLISAFNYAESEGISQPIDLAKIGNLLKKIDGEFSPQRYGHEKLRPLLEQLPNEVELTKDETIYPPRYFAYLLQSDGTKESDIQEPNLRGSVLEKAGRKITKFISEFVYIRPEKYEYLAGLARDEGWGENLSLLKNYIKYTFWRLVYEGKVKFSDDGDTVSFNTGLVDDRYQPIYAYMVKNKLPDNQPWFLDGFCVAGENHVGKMLVGKFNPLPESAYYFTNPADAIYDIHQAPYIDWEHVIEENADRIPVELVSELMPNFDVKSCSDLDVEEIDDYKQQFSSYLKENSVRYRSIINFFVNALDLALKKVRWNYKTAIPVYYPAKNSLSILLPLCLISEDRVDLALLVEKTESGNYQGHTIYPLDWAYKNARLIARPESDWLKADSVLQ